MINIVLSYIFYILIECPFGNLFRAAFNRRTTQKPVENPVENLAERNGLQINGGQKGFHKNDGQNGYINENNNCCKL